MAVSIMNIRYGHSKARRREPGMWGSRQMGSTQESFTRYCDSSAEDEGFRTVTICEHFQTLNALSHKHLIREPRILFTCFNQRSTCRAELVQSRTPPRPLGDLYHNPC